MVYGAPDLPDRGRGYRNAPANAAGSFLAALATATGALNLAIGACIGMVMAGVSHSAARVLDEPPSGY
jgi:hypothetical protein